MVWFYMRIVLEKEKMFREDGIFGFRMFILLVYKDLVGNMVYI